MHTVETTAVAATPALYPMTVTHLHRFPVRHYAEHRTYSWYVDLDDLPRLPWWLRPFARFEAADHFADRFAGTGSDTLRERVDSFLAGHGVALPGGRITALLMPRVLGRAFNPLSLFWCHDAAGVLRHVIAEVHTTRGERHALLLPPGEDGPATVTEAIPNAPFTGSDGYYLLRTPQPEDILDLSVSLHRDNRVALVATWRGRRRSATAGQIMLRQFATPFAPHIAELNLRFQATMLRLRGAGQRPQPSAPDHGRIRSGTTWGAKVRSWAPS